MGTQASLSMHTLLLYKPASDTTRRSNRIGDIVSLGNHLQQPFNLESLN